MAWGVTTMTAHVMTSGAAVWTGGDKGTSRLSRAIVGARSWFARRRLFQTTVDQLNGLTDRQLYDIGVERGDIRTVARDLVARSAL
jgi:uncharacterized protein YjiS (DUF1127 family)